MSTELRSQFADAATLPAGEHRFTPDVCIVGSGAGGAVTAAILADAGLSVLVLEEGGHHTRSEFRMREDAAYPMLYQEDAGRTTEDLAISILQGRSVGGSTTVNWTTCFRTPEDVVAHWSSVHGAKGFAYADLVPHWERVEERLGIAEIPHSEINRNNRTLWDGCKALGYDVKLNRRNVRGCMKSGYCGLGCPVDAKQSTLVTYLPDAVARGAAVLAHTAVDRLEIEAGSVKRIHARALGADGRTPTGATIVVEPRRVVLAAGAIGTPAILLRSGYTRDGLVGRRTFLHPTMGVVGFYKEPIAGFFGAPQSVSSHHFAHRGGEMGFVLETAPVHPMLVALAAPGIGAGHASVMQRMPYLAAYIALHVDGFHPDEPGGRVKLRRSGAPVLDYPVSERLLRAMLSSAKEMARIHVAAGALEAYTTHDPPGVARSSAEIDTFDGLPWEPNRLAIFTAHVMGGSAMGDDPKESVVRSDDLGIHGLENAHVVDGSVFPTSLGVNPQLSIYGLSRLMATRLASKWKGA